MRAYVDSDILIWHLRGQAKAATLLRRLEQDDETELWTGALQRAEVVFFMRPAEVAAAAGVQQPLDQGECLVARHMITGSLADMGTVHTRCRIENPAHRDKNAAMSGKLVGAGPVPATVPSVGVTRRRRL